VRHLNYNHLLYFNTVAREGSIATAAEVLHVRPQTISGQIKLLEHSIGMPLFDRVGRGLVTALAWKKS
jgi:LysR family transcriptional activator of nhaA